jgi:hypothetical protein
MTVSVSDFLSNINDQMVNGARLMGRSDAKQRIFAAIYKGKKQEKSVQHIMRETGLTQIRVLNEASKLGPLVEKVPGGFRKNKSLAAHYRKILDYARNPKKRERVPTKVSPRIPAGRNTSVRISFARPAANAIQITIEDIDSFSAAKKTGQKLGPIREELIKQAFARIVGESGTFKDWGGEKSDLYTSKFRVKNARRAVAIAFKGRGTVGKLVPAKMGKNGDQVGRLFDEPAEVFLIVYCGQIDASVVSQMQAFAIAKKAMPGQKVYFGVIDEDDLGRIAAGYPQAFQKKKLNLR